MGKYQGLQLTTRCSCVAQINPQGGLVFSDSAYEQSKVAQRQAILYDSCCFVKNGREKSL